MVAAAAPSIFFLLLLHPTAAQPAAGELPDDTGVIIVVLASLFLLGFFSIYIRNCTDFQSVTAAAAAASASASGGLDPAVIETFPTMVYSAVKGLKIGKAALECAICLSEFDDDETLRFIPKCDHAFHPECIDSWLESHTTCPKQLHSTSFFLVFLSVTVSGKFKFVELFPDSGSEIQRPPTEVALEVFWVDWVLNRIRGPRSHSAGHSLVQPGGTTDRFTLRLPADFRKQLM
ncbi:unnamed protein product [Linum tenue]|uniref:RING-type E3 ubiquitin transferase n=1 Tax=Linum tenue TaxID=586396 RepID=A0AAV0I5D4_9ROSI|nr:unnamed protein product [Linum tenue]